jgi:hypothetical protein
VINPGGFLAKGIMMKKSLVMLPIALAFVAIIVAVVLGEGTAYPS